MKPAKETLMGAGRTVLRKRQDSRLGMSATGKPSGSAAERRVKTCSEPLAAPLGHVCARKGVPRGPFS